MVARPFNFAIESALFQIDEYRKYVSQSNRLCAEHPEFMEQLLQMLDGLRDIFTQINSAIPENVETVSTEDATQDLKILIQHIMYANMYAVAMTESTIDIVNILFLTGITDKVALS